MKEKTSSPPLKKVESDRPSVCTCSGCQCTSAPWNLRATVQKEATVLVLRAKQAAATFLLFMHQNGHSFLLAYIEKMAACIFTRLFV